MQTNTEVAVASVLALTQNSEAVVDPTSVTIAVTILSQNASALQDETVSDLFVVEFIINFVTFLIDFYYACVDTHGSCGFSQQLAKCQSYHTARESNSSNSHKSVSNPYILFPYNNNYFSF